MPIQDQPSAYTRRRGNRRGAAVVALGAIALVAGACSSDSSDDGAAATSSTAPPGIEVPGATWATISPEEAGFDKTKLDALATEAEGQDSNCLFITKDGKLVAEYYFDGAKPDDSQEVFSATKSVTSTLIGIAQEDGLLDIDDPATDYIPEWKGTESADVTVRNLLSNDSGRHYDAETDYLKMAAIAKDKNKFAIGLAQDAPPETTWAYNNSAIQTLSQVLEVALKTDDPRPWTEEHLLTPIGMTKSHMTTDVSGSMLTFMGLQSTCGDMARFGLLYLNGGRWGDEQIVDADWVAEATTPSQDLNRSYGYLWWLNTESETSSSGDQATGSTGKPERTQLVEGAPADAFFALGMGNQVVSVLPDEGIVAVRLGSRERTKFGVAQLTTGVLEAYTGE